MLTAQQLMVQSTAYHVCVIVLVLNANRPGAVNAVSPGAQLLASKVGHRGFESNLTMYHVCPDSKTAKPLLK